MVLFCRLLILFQRYDNIEEYFAYELSPFPMSLFKDNMMRKPTKSVLAKHLTDRCIQVDDGENENEDDEEIDALDVPDATDEIPSAVNTEMDDVVYVVDGGYLLHRVVWGKLSTYGEVIQQYQNYLKFHYGICDVNFDGYTSGPSVKDHEHLHRNQRSKISPNVTVELSGSIGSICQTSFLANNHNKQKFIDLLTECLLADGHTVRKSDRDADTLIVSTVLDYACIGKNACLLASDTDLLIMLIYFWNDLMGSIVMRSEATKRFPAVERDVSKIASCLGVVQKYITFIHAFGGCDSTSAVFGHGKLAILRLIEKSKSAQELADVFMCKDSTQDSVSTAGMKLFVLLYGGKPCDSLGYLRYIRYMGMASSTKMNPERLPPSERAAHFHSLRVYLQTQEWNCLNDTLNPQWGWKVVGGKLLPLTTDEAAPNELLNIIRCNCQTSAKHPCGGK